MNYTILYSEIDHIHLSIEAQCVSHHLPPVDCHIGIKKCGYAFDPFLDFWPDDLLYLPYLRCLQIPI